MMNPLLRTVTLFSIVAFALPAWACFPKPDAKPSHEISVIDLPGPAIGVGVVFHSEDYAVRVLAEDLLPLLSKEYMAIVSPGDLANALRAKMALGEDFNAEDLIPALTSDPERQRWAAIQAGQKFRYAYANLLQQGKASVAHRVTNQEVPRIKLDRYTDICSRGRNFATPDEKLVLHVVDAIS